MSKHIFRIHGQNADSETIPQISFSDLQSRGSNLFNILYHFAKNRTQVYMYVGPAIISLLIASHGNPDLFVVMRIASAVYFAALATYMYNDVTDISVDKLNSSKRPLVSGRATKREVLALAIMLNVTALVLTYSTNLYATLAILSFIALGILYSHPKTSLKAKFPHKTVATAIGGALASLAGGLAIGNMLPYVVYAALVSFAFLFVMGPIADISDLKGDKAARRRTFPLVVGVNTTLIIMVAVTLVIMISSILSAEVLHINTIGTLMITGICSFVIITLRSLMKEWHSPDVVWQTRNKMKMMHLLLQLSLLVGIFQLA